MSYVEASRTISVNILDFNFFEDEPAFRNGYGLYNDVSGKLLCEDLKIVYVELPKYRREMKGGRAPHNKLERWLSYLAGMEGDEMLEIATHEPMIQEALDLEKMFLLDKKQRLAYIQDLMNSFNMEAREKYLERKAMERGRAEGHVAGRADERRALARKMQAAFMPLNQIIEFTGLSPAEIESMKESPGS